MKILKIENKAAKVTLDDGIDEYSRKELMREIAKTYGASAAGNAEFSELTACVENEVDTLEIYLNSPGGSVFDGYVIHNELLGLRARGVHVTAKVQLAASMASVIAMAADSVQMLPNGRMMIHDASIAIRGNAKQLSKAAALVDGISDEIAEIYSGRTGKTVAEMRGLMLEETWMDSKTAVALGFADGVFDIRATDGKTASNMSLLARLTNPSADEAVERIAALEAQISTTEADNAAAIATLTANLATAENALQEAATLKAELETATGSLTTANLAIQACALQIADLESDLAAAKNSTAQQAVEIAAAAGVSAPLNIEGGENAAPEATLTREEFTNLKPGNAMKFIKSGGKIIN